MKHALHISNTDIHNDSRIAKEIAALIQSSEIIVTAIGLADGFISVSQYVNDAYCFKMPLLSGSLSLFPRPILYLFTLIEFTVRITLISKTLFPKPAIVHCHDTFALPAGWFVKKLFGSHLVYDAHELESNKNGQSIILSKATLAIERFCWSEVDLLVSVSDSIIRWYQDTLGRKESILVLNSPAYDPNSIRQSYKICDNYWIEKFGIPQGLPIFVYLGILGPGRGIELCLEAFSTLQGVAHVVFIGFGRLTGVINEASEKYTNVHYHSPVKHEQVVPLVSSADFGLCLIEDASLSDYLCLPNKLFEYSFAGLGVLASNFPEIEKVVTTYELGVCCNPDSKSIKEAILAIVDSPLIRSPRDISELGWEVQAARLQKAYKYLL
ncbi:glycosyltransferase [Cyanobium sp. Maggiore-St4-Cus]|uniref:glycosyltransferase n=1 Tax=Cyanobium sp. Maggiore-St4-Cus TaxID=2823717 RepID=UPI0020CE6A04|nr:glycosyltransferase [Cyanobium sp. Maggiore-St4-Cus]